MVELDTGWNPGVDRRKALLWIGIERGRGYTLPGRALLLRMAGHYRTGFPGRDTGAAQQRLRREAVVLGVTLLWRGRFRRARRGVSCGTPRTWLEPSADAERQQGQKEDDQCHVGSVEGPAGCWMEKARKIAGCWCAPGFSADGCRIGARSTSFRPRLRGRANKGCIESESRPGG